MAEDNPFGRTYNAMLDPSKQGTISGFIGGLMGAPTQEQAAGGATGRALQELAALRQQGATPQDALMKWFQTPGGQDFFANAGPDGLKSIAAGLATMQAPAPTLNNMPEGSQLASTDQFGKTNIVATNPKSFAPTIVGPQDIAIDRSGNKIAENTNIKGDEPADVRSFKFFAGLAKLPKAEIERIAALKADPTSKDPNSVKAAAVEELTKKYGLDPRLAEALKADIIKIIPIKNEIGQDTGDISVYDMSNPAAGAQIIRSPRKTAEPTVPGTTPSTGAATGALPAAPAEPDTSKPGPNGIPQSNPKYFGTKASMFLGSGVVPSALAGASAIGEQISPKMVIPEGAQANDRQTMIDTLRSDLAAMGQLGGGIGVNKGVLEGYLKLAPTGGARESPHAAIQKGIRLYEHIDQEIQAEEQKFNNARLPIEERKASQARAEGWRRVQRDMPTYEEMQKMEESIRNGTSGASTVAGGVKTLMDAGSKILTESKKQAADVSKELPNTAKPVDFEAMSPQELLAVDARTLQRNDKIKYLRKLDALKKGATIGPAVTR